MATTLTTPRTDEPSGAGVRAISHRGGAWRGRVAARARWPQDSGFLRRPCGRRPGLWPSALAGGARAPSAANGVSNQRPAHASIRERAAARLAKFAGFGLDTVFWINSGAEANENALKLAFKTHRAQQGRRVGAGLSRQNRRRRRGDLGCAGKMVRFSAHALRRELHAARRSRRGRAIHRSGYGRGHRRAGAGRGRGLRRRQADAAGAAPALRRSGRIVDIR